MSHRVANRHRQPHRQDLRAADRGRHGARPGPAPDQGRRGRIRVDVLRPGLHQHRLLPLLGHLHRRRRRHPRTPRLLDRAALRALDLPRDRLPADLRRAADRRPARPLGLRHHPPHLRARGPEAVLPGLPLRRPPDGDAAGRRRRALDLLPGREADRRPGRALHGRRPPDRQGADPGRLLLPAQHGPALRLPGQRAQLRRELPLDDVQEDRRPAHPEAGPLEGARRPLHPPRRPRTELLDQRRARRRLLRRRPLLGRRGRGRGALRAAARRRQRGGAADAAADRVAGQHPRLPRAGEGPRGETDGLRPPRLQELRPAGADHPAAHGRGLRGDRVQPAGRDRPRAGEAGARRRVLHLAQALPERRLLLGDHLRGAGDPGQHVHGPVHDPPHRRLDRAVDGDAGRPGDRKSPARARSTPASASATTSRSTTATAPRKSSARRRAARNARAAAPEREPSRRVP